jgi:hypothetical protein
LLDRICVPIYTRCRLVRGAIPAAASNTAKALVLEQLKELQLMDMTQK